MGDLGAPMLCAVEMHNRGPPRVRITLGTGGPELVHALDEEYEHEVFIWATKRRGDATFFDDRPEITSVPAAVAPAVQSVPSNTGGDTDTGASDTNTGASDTSDAGGGAGMCYHQ